MEAKDVFKRLVSLADRERQVAVATVVRAYGSTPREVGAKMVILENGDFFGTVGGGCGEAEVWQEARHVLRRGRPSTVHVDLTEDPESGGEKICGGRMDVFIDVWGADELRTVHGIVDLLDQGRGVSLATVLAAPDESEVRPGRHLVIDEAGRTDGALGDAEVEERLRAAAPGLIAGRRSCVAAFPAGEGPPLIPAPRRSAPGAIEVFMEVLEHPPVLVIAGAGHCALPLSRMGRMLGFEVLILDDRPDCATAERFPDATRILLGDLEEEVGTIPIGPDTCVVLVTRGHRQDEQILRRIVREPLGYIGMIGSKRRIAAVFADMERDGFEREYLDRVYSPIGLDIGAQTPEEIAVSILAEIIGVRKGGSGRSLRFVP
jgi:xanthine dehydrogenase accessory factor